MGQRDGKALNEIAARWLAKLQHEEVPPEVRSEFEAWLDADPANAVAFARVEQAWERAGRLQATPQIHAVVEQPARRPSRQGWALAASVLLTVLGLAIWLLVRQSNTYSTAIGERRTVVLNDGSQISMNTDSRLKVDLDERQRTVRLIEGEGLFKVAHDPSRPFVVIAGDTAVRAVGTAFNVRLRGEQLVEVTVTEGVVSVGDKRIAADSAAVIAAGTVSAAPLSKDVLQRRVAWRDGVIELRGETLEQAVAEFNRYQRRKLVIADPSIATIRVGGRFETDEADKFVSAVTAAFPVRAVAGDDGQVFLLGR